MPHWRGKLPPEGESVQELPKRAEIVLLGPIQHGRDTGAASAKRRRLPTKSTYLTIPDHRDPLAWAENSDANRLRESCPIDRL
jgi:hypothetical protein